jgi:hypothetical protein
MRLDSDLKKVVPNISRPKKSRHFLMHWMSVKLPDNFQMREHSWSCRFHIIGPYGKFPLKSSCQPSWSEGGTTRHNFGRGPSNDYFIKVWFQLSNWFQTRRFVSEFPIGSYVKLSSAVGPSWWKGRTAGHIFGREPSNDYFINGWSSSKILAVKK